VKPLGLPSSASAPAFLGGRAGCRRARLEGALVGGGDGSGLVVGLLEVGAARFRLREDAVERSGDVGGLGDRDGDGEWSGEGVGSASLDGEVVE
jgi:hypothetical protein